jgi:peptidoglycan/xylan/chitin deacetylase (PgdA/CDA1 family)
MKYFTKTPWWLKKIYPGYEWEVRTREKIIYLSFDDGPHPTITPFVLDQLKSFNAKASFFCIGENVKKYPEVYQRILDEGHVTGNHTSRHLDGWKTSVAEYAGDIEEAAYEIHSDLFRPPYGRIRKEQARKIGRSKDGRGYRIIMWTVLSADFDEKLNGEQCAMNVKEKAGPGSIIVFHDSEKAYNRLAYALPEVLNFFREKGYRFERLP